MDGKEVRLIIDICDDDTKELLVPFGTRFVWSDDCEYQMILGMQIYVDRAEVELVNW